VWNLIQEKKNLLCLLDKAKTAIRFDDKLTIGEAERLLEELRERATINHTISLSLSKCIVSGAINSSNLNMVKYLDKSSSIVTLISDIEEKLLIVKHITDI
jgi:hypothetical protein